MIVAPLLLLLLQPSEEEKLRRRVEAAVFLATEYLEEQARGGLPKCPAEAARYDELVLYALLHAGAKREGADFQSLLTSVVEGPYDRVYSVALRAMALEAVDSAQYLSEILMCGKYLLDQQSVDGHWAYGSLLDRKTLTVPLPAPDSSTRARPFLKRAPRKDREKSGDGSNSQYAMLGLRACRKSGIEIDSAVYQDAAAAWERSQQSDGGWGYGRESAAGDESYGSMTAGAVASLIIANEALGKPWNQDVRISKGIQWIAHHWSSSTHPKYPDPQRWLHYYFYAVERVGGLLGAEKIGEKEWYSPIRDALLDQQKRDGSWVGTDELSIADTCFAILFLRRATVPAPKVATGK